MTTVTNFKTVKAHWDRNAREWDSEQYVYIGRHNATYNLPQSKWANPFVMGSESQRAGVIFLYRSYITERIESGLVDLEELRGKTLVCWCKKPGVDVPCHGDVLLEFLGEL